MTKESLVFVFGLLIFLISFLGIPRDWKEIFYIASGAVLMIVGFMLRRSAFVRSIEHHSGERNGDAFSELPHIREKENDLDLNTEDA